MVYCTISKQEALRYKHACFCYLYMEIYCSSDFFLMNSLRKSLQKNAQHYYVTIAVFDIKEGIFLIDFFFSSTLMGFLCFFFFFCCEVIISCVILYLKGSRFRHFLIFGNGQFFFFELIAMRASDRIQTHFLYLSSYFIFIIFMNHKKYLLFLFQKELHIPKFSTFGRYINSILEENHVMGHGMQSYFVR